MIATKAAVCRAFGIRWCDYGSLSVREHRVLVGILQDEADRAASSRLATAGLEADTRIDADGTRLERVR